MKLFAHAPLLLLPSAALSATVRRLPSLLLPFIVFFIVFLIVALSAPARAANVIIDQHTDLDASNTSPDDDYIIQMNANHSPIVNLLAGGAIGSVQTYDDSILQVSGGTVARDAMAFESSQIALHTGAVIDDLRSFDDAVVLVFGGSVGAGIIEASGSSVINIEGGQILSDLHAQDSAIIQLFGSNLTLNGTLLNGTLRDGTPILRNALTSDDGLIILHNVPEPSSFLLMGAGLLFAAACRRRAHK